jgi:hypothetical protein
VLHPAFGGCPARQQQICCLSRGHSVGQWRRLELPPLRTTGHSREACPPRRRGSGNPARGMGRSRRFKEWIPAFAGMTTAWSADASQMTPLPPAEHRLRGTCTCRAGPAFRLADLNGGLEGEPCATLSCVFSRRRLVVERGRADLNVVGHVTNRAGQPLPGPLLLKLISAHIFCWKTGVVAFSPNGAAYQSPGQRPG